MAISLILALLAQATIVADAPAPAPPVQVAPGVRVVAGAMVAGRGPDANTIVFDAPDGLVVVDTGRHRWHSDAIAALAAVQQRPIAAILNTHWHLDHSSGNGRLKAAFPQALLYATGAIERALGADGFLTRNVAGARAMLRDGALDAVQRQEAEIFLATMADSARLRPDVVVDQSQRVRIAGKWFDLRVAANAASDADLWIYDARTQIAVVGDIVTLPAPFFETACPQGWRAALDRVWATPFVLAIPGHGAPMTRADFDVYRTAYVAFIECVASEAEASTCANRWRDAVAPLLADERAQAAASQMAEYYVGYLRQNGDKSPDCLTR